MKTLETPLKEHPFFQGLDDSHFETIAGCGRNIQFAAGETIFREGQEADYFYVIRHGSVALDIHGAQRGAITIETVAAGEVSPWVFAPGQFIGWSPLRSLLPLIFFSFRRTRWALHKPLNCRGC